MSEIQKNAPSKVLLWLNASALTGHGKLVLDADQLLSLFALPLSVSIDQSNKQTKIHKRDIKLNTENRFSHLCFP